MHSLSIRRAHVARASDSQVNMFDGLRAPPGLLPLCTESNLSLGYWNEPNTIPGSGAGLIGGVAVESPGGVARESLGGGVAAESLGGASGTSAGLVVSEAGPVLSPAHAATKARRRATGIPRRPALQCDTGEGRITGICSPQVLEYRPTVIPSAARYDQPAGRDGSGPNRGHSGLCSGLGTGQLRNCKLALPRRLGPRIAME
jgi:hypothetical protein